ncbi:MAG: SDR family oxidoreductase [Christensenellaceae bacterium]|jgi:NAD(P)-dependent dehydrogenase (short-subunit alcohol dehydrogenase family)|nr:SDR family oxidoreductase [Christensenellaceae bacterium]
MKNVYVITGATGGMGVDLARKLIYLGEVVLFDLDLDKLNQLQKELGGNSFVCAGDITKREDIKRLAEICKKRGGVLSVVHLAGVYANVKSAERVLDINLVGTASIMEEFYKIIGEKSVFINTSSIAAYLYPYTKETSEILKRPLDKDFMQKILPFTKGESRIAYSLSKQGVILLTREWTKLFGEKNARVLAVSPGLIQTPMLDKVVEVTPDSAESLLNSTPCHRVGRPEDITSLVLFLLSEKAGFINGTDILIDGGVISAMGKQGG